MKKSLLLVFLSITSFLQMNAQNLPQTYVITSDTVTLYQFLDKNYWQILKDKKGSFTINEVRHPPLSNQFTYFNKIDSSQFEKTNWFRFVLKNESGKQLK
ncbi:MAG: 7TM-DISM domain-containing protein [Ginsengibacter sp.]